MAGLEVLLKKTRTGHAMYVVVRPPQRLAHDETNRQAPVEQQPVPRKGDQLRVLVPVVHGIDALVLCFKPSTKYK